ncbi:hypothetical protein LF1_01320 [Rubripirellula obstinata]|uniref:Prenyltransferase and squalene oxidase repeat protein n=1 Tax=Rubripirellula obstinata TaxID=406547 RepID=A0A5B1CE70_9BACT|nr:prenyltransferase/squalene oxidase repeat-containing protein [Rubripirellula obstinata]KAA1257644.1 hypothetical protein LF1_01320 [Rubripirellula obstinata]
MSLDRRQWIAFAASGILLGGRDSKSQERLPADLNVRNLYVPDEFDQALQRGVEFLLETQRADGAIADKSNSIAMTALSVMAMASIGMTPSTTGKRGRAMERAIEYVLDHDFQDARGYFGDRDGSRMYGHGIVTLMLTEMLGMGSTLDQNRRMHESLVNAIKLILAAQEVSKPEKMQGGWRYSPSSRDSDLSVSVWQLMALRSAKNDGVQVPGEAIDRAIEFLKNSYASPIDRSGEFRDAISGFCYTPGTRHATFTMTSAGLLALQVCGQYDSPMVSGATQWLLAHPPRISERFFYYGIYYYAQAMHQVGGEAAAVADKLVPELLIESQRNDGSWIGRGGEEKNVGTVYATTLAILSLSVRYHYLPIYQK